MGKNGYIYIMSNFKRTVLYIGVTSNLEKRIHEHTQLGGSSFTSKYKCKYLLYFECFDRIQEAIDREKELKRFKKEWKLNLIKSVNPNLISLNAQVQGYN